MFCRGCHYGGAKKPARPYSCYRGKRQGRRACRTLWRFHRNHPQGPYLPGEGGACQKRATAAPCRPGALFERPLSARSTEHVAEKAKIARAAVELIPVGGVVILDAGSTNLSGGKAAHAAQRADHSHKFRQYCARSVRLAQHRVFARRRDARHEHGLCRAVDAACARIGAGGRRLYRYGRILRAHRAPPARPMRRRR